MATTECELGVKIRLDDRQSAAIIYASSGDQAMDAERSLNELLSGNVADVAEDISLRDAEYPPGLMKVEKKIILLSLNSVLVGLVVQRLRPQLPRQPAKLKPSYDPQ